MTVPCRQYISRDRDSVFVAIATSVTNSPPTRHLNDFTYHEQPILGYTGHDRPAPVRTGLERVDSGDSSELEPFNRRSPGKKPAAGYTGAAVGAYWVAAETDTSIMCTIVNVTLSYITISR